MTQLLMSICLVVALSCTSLAAVVERHQRDVEPDCYGMTATCDNTMKVYFDGVIQPGDAGQLANWRQASQFCVPYGTQVIGIECLDLHVVAGTIASFSNGLVTDGSWQCSSQASDDWALPSSQSSWPDAYEIMPNLNSRYWGTVGGISTSAKWIWTTGWQGEDTTVYCRKVVSVVQPSQDCSKCSYEGGSGYLPSSDPCKYIVCTRLSDGDGYSYTHKEMNCSSGTLWDQSIQGCNHDTAGVCDPIPVPTHQTQASGCNLETVQGDNTKFKDKTTGLETSCAPGTVFDIFSCTCVHGSNEETCDRPLLYFPFDDHFNSEGCEKAVTVEAGSGSVTLSWDAKKTKCAQFDGNSLLLVPFLNNYFANNDVQAFTVALWFKWTGDTSKIGGLINYGSCETEASFDIHVGSGLTVYASMDANTPASVTSGTFLFYPGDWIHVAEVYDGSSLKLYINGNGHSTTSLTGPITNSQCSLTIGQTGAEGNGIFKGSIDELMVFMRALDDKEVKDLVDLNYDYTD